MANYGGNSFPQTKAESYADRLPIWNYIDHSKLVGVAVLPDETNTVGKRFPLGTPVQLSNDGSAPKTGAEATAPDGLLRADVVMGEGGCTFTIVRSGSIRANLMEAEVTAAQRAKLPLIEFDEDPFETVVNAE